MSSDYGATGQNERWHDSSSGSSRQGGGSRSAWWGCLLGGAAALVVLALIGVAVFIVLFAGIASAAGAGATIRGGAMIQEWTVSGKSGRPKVALIPVQGALVPAGEPGEDPVSLMRGMLDRAREDDAVKGVILLVASGGGEITTCDVMRRAVQDYRDRTGEPVVTLMGSVAASGAYYVSCGTDYLIAHPTSITGSIGVLWPFYDASGLLGKVGVQDRTVKSGAYKQLASPFAERSAEEWEREKAVLQGVIDQLHARFLDVVAQGRGMDPTEVRKLADGRIFTSQEAVENKLIDDIGYREDAVEKVKQLAGLEDVHLVQYGRVPSLLEVILSGAIQPDINVQLGESLPTRRVGAPMYLWAPAAR